MFAVDRLSISQSGSQEEDEDVAWERQRVMAGHAMEDVLRIEELVKVGAQAESCLGIQAESCLGVHRESCLGVHAESCLGVQAESCLGVHTESSRSTG